MEDVLLNRVLVVGLNPDFISDNEREHPLVVFWTVKKAMDAKSLPGGVSTILLNDGVNACDCEPTLNHLISLQKLELQDRAQAPKVYYCSGSFRIKEHLRELLPNAGIVLNPELRATATSQTNPRGAIPVPIEGVLAHRPPPAVKMPTINRRPGRPKKPKPKKPKLSRSREKFGEYITVTLPTRIRNFFKHITQVTAATRMDQIHQAVAEYLENPITDKAALDKEDFSAKDSFTITRIHLSNVLAISMESLTDDNRDIRDAHLRVALKRFFKKHYDLDLGQNLLSQLKID